MCAMERTGTLQDLPWTEDEVFELLRVAYAAADIDQADVDRAIRLALKNEGESYPLGSTGRDIRVTPGVKRRLGIC